MAVVGLVGERDLPLYRKKMWWAVLLDGIREVQSSPRNYFHGGNLGILIRVFYREALKLFFS